MDGTDSLKACNQMDLDVLEDCHRAPQDCGMRADPGVREVFNALSDAILVVNATGLILQANASAQAILVRRDGLTVHGGRLTAERKADATALASALRRATAPLPVAASFQLSRKENARPYLATVAPLRSGLAGAELHRRIALVCLIDPEGVARPTEMQLVEMFGLTRSEAQLALALQRGAMLEEAAVKRGVTLSTVRSQLRAILAKTGARRQSDLLRLFGALPRVRAD